MQFDHNTVIGIALAGGFIVLLLATFPLFVLRRDKYPLRTRNTPLLTVFTIFITQIVLVISVREVGRPVNFPCIIYLYTVFTFPVGYAFPHFLRGMRAYFRTRITRTMLDEGRATNRYDFLMNTRFLMVLFGFGYMLHITAFLLEYLLQPELNGHVWDGCALTTEWTYFAAITIIYIVLVTVCAVMLWKIREQHFLKYEMVAILLLSTLLGGGFIALNINDQVFAAVDQRFRVSYIVSLMAIGGYCTSVVAPLAATYLKRAKHKLQTRDFMELSDVHTLEQVLCSTERLPYLKRYVVEQATYQYLSCWLEITEYRTTSDKTRRKKLYWQIMLKYIANNGAHTIDINETLPKIDTETLRVRDTLTPPCFLFEDVRGELYNYMETNIFPQFIRSEHYAQLTTMMMSEQQREQLRREQQEIIMNEETGDLGAQNPRGFADLGEFGPVKRNPSKQKSKSKRGGGYQATDTEVDDASPQEMIDLDEKNK